MVLRKLIIVALALSASSSVAILHAQFLVTFQGPATLSTDPTVTFFDTATLTQVSTLTVPSAVQFLSTADGTQLYLVSNIAGSAITVLSPLGAGLDVTNIGASAQQIGNFANPVNSAALSPDSSYLVVGENAVHVFLVSTDIDLTPNGLAIAGGATVISIAVSYDSQTAYALATLNDTSYLASISLGQLTITNTLTIPGTATGVSLGPNGLLYVGAPNAILEINPATLTTTPAGLIAVDATPGPIVFTPDGNYAIAANSVFGTGPAVLLLNLNDHLIEGSVPFTGLAELAASPITELPTTFDTLLVASPTTAYAFSTLGGAFYNLQLGVNGGLILTVPNIGPVISGTPVVTVSAQSSIALSNDLGTSGVNFPQYLFLLSNGTIDGTGVNNLYRIDPASNLMTAQAPLLSLPAAVAYFAPTATGNTSVTALTYGSNQVLVPGQVSLPLVVRFLDQNGLPISGLGVNWGADVGAITPVNTATGKDGYAQAIYTAGRSPTDFGAISITAAGGNVEADFVVNVGTTLPVTPTTLTVVSGQGQVVLQDLTGVASGTPLPFVVQATNADGSPAANAVITFTLTSGAGGLLATDGSSQPSLVVATDAIGQAQAEYIPPQVPYYRGFQPATVTASAVSDSSATAPTIISQDFYINIVPLDIQYCGTPPCPPVVPIFGKMLAPPPGTVLSGPASSTLTGAAQVLVTSANGIPMPNVGVQATTGTNPNLPNASCAGPAGGGVALTNASGIATCDVVLNGVPGTQPLFFSVLVQGATGTGINFGGYTLTITAGAPANVTKVSGDNQTVPSGSILPEPLIVKVTDAGNNPIPNTPVSWTVPSGGFNLTAFNTVTGALGTATATGFLSAAGGSTVTIQATAGSASATFSVLSSVPAATIVIVSGNNQSAQVNTPFPNPLVVQLADKNGHPASFATVGFTTSGAATLSSNTVVAGADGQASVAVTSAGPVAGPLTVTASYGAGKSAIKVNFSLTVEPLGPVGPAILNSASLAPGIAPGGLVTFIGPGLAPTISGVVTDPAQFAGYSITFDGNPAPILALINDNGNEQINAQVPFEEPPTDTATVVIQTPTGSATLSNVVVSTFAPGTFTNGTLDANGQTYPLALAIRPDGSYVSATNPAQRGENITFFATGLGQTVPAASTGVPAVPGQIVGSALFAGVNNQGSAVISAVAQPGSIGVYAITIQISTSTVPGPAQPLSLFMVDTTGTGYNAPPAFIPIE